LAVAALAELRRIVGEDGLLTDVPRSFLQDAAGAVGVEARADAVVLPSDPEQVAAVVRWCAENRLPVTPRGGGTGLTGGAVPVEGGVVLGLERMRRLRRLDPLQWRMEVDAGMSTGDVQRLARENGLVFPPDPGAAEESQIGGNVATNAGGPHAFKYGVTGAWVTGLEVVLPSGELVRLGGTVRKDAAGYDLKRLMIGSEGTLGVITGVALRLLPAPLARSAAVAFYADAEACQEGLEAAFASGVVAAALDFVDGRTLEIVASTYPGSVPPGVGCGLMVEADGHTVGEHADAEAALLESIGEGAIQVDRHTPVDPLWRWRDTFTGAVAARRGLKLSEDVAVPVDRFATTVEAVVEIAARHGLEGCSWGHAGDGNLHASFLIEPGHRDQLSRAEAAAAELFGRVIELDGSVSGEHGIGSLKRAHYLRHADPAVLELQRQVKRAIDPLGLMNPQKVF
jgi:glycolate oxidase subunit GlcD